MYAMLCHVMLCFACLLFIGRYRAVGVCHYERPLSHFNKVQLFVLQELCTESCFLFSFEGWKENIISTLLWCGGMRAFG